MELAIFFSVGFLTAAFLALLAAPAISRRAWRLAAARARLQSPLSETRSPRRARRVTRTARHRTAAPGDAVESRRKRSRAPRVEIGRQAGRIVALEDVSAERAEEIARLRMELGALEKEARDLNVQLGTQEIVLRDLTFQRDDTDRSLALARSRISELEMLADEGRAVIASLEARAAGLRVEISDRERAAHAADSERARLSAALSERIDASNRLKGEIEAADARFADLA